MAGKKVSGLRLKDESRRSFKFGSSYHRGSNFGASIEPGNECLASASTIKQLRKSYGQPFRSSALSARSLVQLSKSASDTHKKRNGENSPSDKKIYRSFQDSEKQKLTKRLPATMVLHQQPDLGLLPVPGTEANLEFSSVSLLGLGAAASSAVVNTCGEVFSKQYPLELFRKLGRARRLRKRRHRQRIMKAVGSKSSKEASQLESKGQDLSEVIKCRAKELPNNFLINEEYKDAKNQGEACISSLARFSLKKTASSSNSELSNDKNQLDCIGSSPQRSQILLRRETAPLHSYKKDLTQHQGCRKQVIYHHGLEKDVSCKSRQEAAASSRTVGSAMTSQSLGSETLKIPLASLPAYRTERKIRLEDNKRPSVNSSYTSGLGLTSNYWHTHIRHKTRQINKNRFTALCHGKHSGVGVDRQNIKHHSEQDRHDKGQNRGEGAGQREKHTKNYRSKRNYVTERRERFSGDFKNTSKKRSCSSEERKPQRSGEASLENFSSAERDAHQNSKGGGKYSTVDSFRDSYDQIKCSKVGLFSSSKEFQHLNSIICALVKHEHETVDENSLCKHFSSEASVKHNLSLDQQTENDFGLPAVIYEDISDGEVQPDVKSLKETVCSFNCNSKPSKRSQLERSRNSFEDQTFLKLSLEQQTEDSHGLSGTVYEDLSDEEIQLAEEPAMYREVHLCAGYSELKIENHKGLSNDTMYENVSDDEIQPNGKYLLCREDYFCASNSEFKAESSQGLSNNTIYENVSDEEILPEEKTTKLLGETEHMQPAPWLFSVPPQHRAKGGIVRLAAKNSEGLQMDSSPIPTVISVRSDCVPSKRVVERTLTVPLLSWKEVSFDLRQRDSLNSISGKNETELLMVNPVKDQVYGSDARSGISSLEEATGNADGSIHTRSIQKLTPHGQSSVQETDNPFSQSNPNNRSHVQIKEGWQTKEKQPLVISPEKLQAFRNALKGSEKFRPKWPSPLKHEPEVCEIQDNLNLTRQDVVTVHMHSKEVASPVDQASSISTISPCQTAAIGKEKEGEMPQTDTDLSRDREEKMREPEAVKERKEISHTGKEEESHLAIIEHNVEAEMEELEASEDILMDIDSDNQDTPCSAVHPDTSEFSTCVACEPCGNQNLVTPAKHFEHSAAAAGMRQVLTNTQERCSLSVKSTHLETCDEFSHHISRQASSESNTSLPPVLEPICGKESRQPELVKSTYLETCDEFSHRRSRQASSESDTSLPPVLEPIYGKESRQPDLINLHQMGKEDSMPVVCTRSQNSSITLSKGTSRLNVLARQGSSKDPKSSGEAVCHSNSQDSSRRQDQHDALDTVAQSSRNTQELGSTRLKEKLVTTLPQPFAVSKHCADLERVDFFDDIYDGTVVPALSSESSDDELSEGLDSPSKFSTAHHSSPSSPCDSLNLQHNSNLVGEDISGKSSHSFSIAQPAAQYSLDDLLMETKNNEAVNKEIQALQEELQRGILLGGFEAVGENECNSDDDGLSAEHQEALEKLKLNYSHIPEVHPGEAVLLATGCGRIFNEALSPLSCGFSPTNNSSLEKEIASIQPAYVGDLICSGVISMTSLSCKESLMRWMFFLSSVHSNGIIALKCTEEITEMIQWHMEKNGQGCNTWSPEISDILRILVNWGAKPEELIFDQSVLRNVNQLSEVLEVGHSVPQPKVTYRNIEAVLRVLSSCLQARPSYRDRELTQLLLMLCKLALDPMLSNQSLQYEIQVCLSSVMKCYSLSQWLRAVPSLSRQLAKLTSHHHSHVYLAQHLGFSERSRQLQQQMAFQLLKDALPLGDGGDENIERKFQLRDLTELLPQMKTFIHGDHYRLYSLVQLLDMCVGPVNLRLSQRKQLYELAENLQGLISEIKDNLRMMDIAKVKDMMLCMRSKWHLVLKCANERQRSLFSCWSKQDLPTKMNVERVEASMSDDESDEDMKEDQNVKKLESTKSNVEINLDPPSAAGSDLTVGSTNTCKREKDCVNSRVEMNWSSECEIDSAREIRGSEKYLVYHENSDDDDSLPELN